MQRLMQRPSVLERYREEVDAELRAAFDGCSSPLYDMLRYHLGWQTADGQPVDGTAGKGLRSTLCLLACEALGGRPPSGAAGGCGASTSSTTTR